MSGQLTVIWQDKLWRLSFFCVLCMGVVVAGIMPYRSIIAIDVLGFSNFTFAIIAMVGPLLRLGFALMAGIFADQTGRYRDIFALTALFGTVGGVLLVFLPSKFTFALSIAILFPLATTAISQCFTLSQLATNRNKKMDAEVSRSIVRAAFSTMIAIVPPIMALFIAGGMAMIDTYLLPALAGFIIFTLVMTTWPKGSRPREDEKSDLTFMQALRELMAVPILLRVFAVALMHSVVLLTVFVFGLIILNNLGGHEAEVGLFMGGIATIEVLTMLAAPLILQFISKPSFLLVGALVHTVFFVPFGLLPSMDYAWVLVLPAGIGTGAIIFTMTGYMQQLFAHRPGAGGSLIAVTQSVGMTLASVIFAIGTSFTDYIGTAWIGAAFAIFGGVLLFALDGFRVMSRAWREQKGLLHD